eukprot:COSAG02_NODE_27618_length_606_cov_0.690335_1_plen_34_part_10
MRLKAMTGVSLRVVRLETEIYRMSGVSGTSLAVD